MANIYVRSTDGNNADNGSTWALAKATLGGAAAIDAAGDTIYVSQSHAESTAGAVSVAFNGTRASTVRVLGGNDAAEPPTALSTAPTVSTTGLASISVGLSAGGSSYVYGITFQAGSGANSSNILLGTASGRMVFENCTFSLGTNTGAASKIQLNGQDSMIEWRNCNIKYGNTGHNLGAGVSGSTFRWIGGSVVSGSSTPSGTNAIFGNSGTGGIQLIEGVDFSNFGAGVHIDNGGSSGTNSTILRECKLPSGWSGSLVRTALTSPRKVAMYNCSAGSENYRLWIEKVEGSIRDEATLVRTAGATDGVTRLSWKVVATSDCNYPAAPVFTDEILAWNNDTNVSKTLTVHILHDSATNLKDDEVWIEVSYLGSSATPINTLITDAKTDVLATAADQTASSEAWTTTGMANPNKQKLSVTFTPQMRGFFIARVALGKASKTIYVCPKMEVA